MTIEIDVTNYNGKACARFDVPRRHHGPVSVWVEDGDVLVDEIDGVEMVIIPLDTLRAAIAAHDAAALWPYSDERDWERTDASGCQWQIRSALDGHGGLVFSVWRNDGGGFVQVGEPHATWGKAMFAAEGMVVK